MGRALPSVLAVALATATASCAALWGFQDATDPADGGDASLARADARGDGDVWKKDAEAADAGAVMAMLVDAGSHELPDVGVPTAVCAPPCGPGLMCARAVGGVPLCVESTACTSSDDCDGQGCCAWLDYDSGTGRCQGMGFPGVASCLCVDGVGSKMKPTCQKCERPSLYPMASVTVCAGP